MVLLIFFSMLRRPPRSTRTDTLFPFTTLFRSLVQNEIRYLYRGMENGNYVPQAPEATWSLRYGDCKAKTLLLLAMLDQLGIEARPALVSSAFGDLLRDRLPTLGAFDHVIVEAKIAGTAMWLDGTTR